VAAVQAIHRPGDSANRQDVPGGSGGRCWFGQGTDQSAVGIAEDPALRW